jgi:hypothetical protein
MMTRWTLAVWLVGCVGCATTKESDTARTGLEQLLISSAVDRSLDKVDLQPMRYAKVYIETKYLDCVDKNYVLISMHQRLMNNGCTLVEKPEEADVVLEIGSGAVGTDRTELFVGVPEIPLPPPSPIAIPRLSLFTRTKAMGTAKLRVLAYDAKSKLPVVNSDIALARTDYKNMSLLATGSHVSGDIARELERATGQNENFINLPGGTTQVAKNNGGQVR